LIVCRISIGTIVNNMKKNCTEYPIARLRVS
jgi:hypothetical protein